MSLRLASPFVRSTSRKPRIVGWVGGCPVWSISGGAPDGDGNDGDTSGDAAPGSEGDGSDQKDDDDDKDKEGASPNAVVTREEFDRLFARMQAADRAKTAAEQKVREYEDKDKSELERLEARAKEAEAALTAAQEKMRAQAIRLAFLSVSSDITWHDPEDALAFAMRNDDLKSLEVNEDGSVDKNTVKRVVGDLTKSKPYLVKKQGTAADEDSGPSGHQPSGNGNKKDLDKSRLVEKYPALRR